ncbi:Vacuolar protein sorting-associated protein 51 [Blomia tropicalis]|nr:Vacuolar protein sorting-associated protein 51 [Blomia tropicalis]
MADTREESDETVSPVTIINPLDMNSTEFNPDIYMSKLLKESRLSELMDTEQMLFKQIQTLDSEMQTLIYENYNKFISATDTVRKMSSHFDKMEHELNILSKNMKLITNKSNEIAINLSGKRDELSRMSDTHFLLNKIQFILELPTKMQTLIEQNRLVDAANNYLHARKALDLYSHFPSIKNIQLECSEMLNIIKFRFYEQLSCEESSTTEINESIEYLIKFDEDASNLCDKYFEMCEKKLDNLLNSMRSHLETDETNIPVMDILEFIDNVCNNYLGSLNTCIIFYSDVFFNKNKIAVSNQSFAEIEEKLKSFVDKRMEDLFDIILKRIRYERKSSNNIIMFVRALDRFYKRIQKLNKIYSFTDFSESGQQIVYESTQDQCNFLLTQLTTKYQEELANVRHDIINDISKSSTITRNANLKLSLNESNGNALSDTVISFETKICENLKSCLTNLGPFMDSELTFLRKDFKDKFVKHCIFENIVLEYLHFILNSAIEFEQTYTTSHIPSQLILILSKICLDLSNSIITYLFDCAEEIFGKSTSNRASINAISKEARDYSQRLLNIYVWIEGQSISHMIRKSVETRDWLSSVEPRSVRSVMKRVIEDITLIDFHVGQLYEEGVRVERSSDSSRTFSSFNYNKKAKSSRSKSSWSYSASSFENNIISNIHKLFNDKIEIFGKVEFSKLSIVTGVVKIGLKTLIECIRLCTFSRYGFQQMQVDAYYLQTHLWKFTSDEKIVANLIEDVITSTKKRCLDPTSMERSVIENICENV